MYGPEINRDTSTSHNFNGYGVVMYNTMFKEHGFIQAFEWNVIQIGTFKFVVCGLSDNNYNNTNTFIVSKNSSFLMFSMI